MWQQKNGQVLVETLILLAAILLCLQMLSTQAKTMQTVIKKNMLSKELKP